MKDITITGKDEVEVFEIENHTIFLIKADEGRVYGKLFIRLHNYQKMSHVTEHRIINQQYRDEFYDDFESVVHGVVFNGDQIKTFFEEYGKEKMLSPTEAEMIQFLSSYGFLNVEMQDSFKINIEKPFHIMSVSPCAFGRMHSSLRNLMAHILYDVCLDYKVLACEEFDGLEQAVRLLMEQKYSVKEWAANAIESNGRSSFIDHNSRQKLVELFESYVPKKSIESLLKDEFLEDYIPSEIIPFKKVGV